MNSTRNRLMVVLALIFVLFYTAALLGWLKPLSDTALAMRLESIIFLIIGYYFASLPAQNAQALLKDEVSHQTKRADAAQHLREQAQIERELLEEKLKNVRAVLLSAGGGSSKSRAAKKFTGSDLRTGEEEANDREALRYSIKTAAEILNS